MKQEHRMWLAVLLLLPELLSVFLLLRAYDASGMEKKRLERAVRIAAEAAAEQGMMAQREALETMLALTETVFFETLFAAYGCLDQPEQQARLAEKMEYLAVQGKEYLFLCRRRELRRENGELVWQRVWVSFPGRYLEEAPEWYEEEYPVLCVGCGKNIRVSMKKRLE